MLCEAEEGRAGPGWLLRLVKGWPLLDCKEETATARVWFGAAVWEGGREGCLPACLQGLGCRGGNVLWMEMWSGYSYVNSLSSSPLPSIPPDPKRKHQLLSPPRGWHPWLWFPPRHQGRGQFCPSPPGGTHCHHSPQQCPVCKGMPEHSKRDRVPPVLGVPSCHHTNRGGYGAPSCRWGAKLPGGELTVPPPLPGLHLPSLCCLAPHHWRHGDAWAGSKVQLGAWGGWGWPSSCCHRPAWGWCRAV